MIALKLQTTSNKIHVIVLNKLQKTAKPNPNNLKQISHADNRREGYETKRENKEGKEMCKRRSHQQRVGSSPLSLIPVFAVRLRNTRRFLTLTLFVIYSFIFDAFFTPGNPGDFLRPSMIPSSLVSLAC